MIRPGSRWRHWKGYLVTVLCVATHTESAEELVIYRKDSDPPGMPPRARPLVMWLDNETTTGEQRFVPIGAPVDKQELARLLSQGAAL